MSAIMVKWEPGDIIPMTEFLLAGRITDSRWSAQPQSILDRIKPLSGPRSRQLYRRSPLSRPFHSPPDVGELVVTREQSLDASGSPEGIQCLRWFQDLPIDPSDQVYLCWGIGEGVAAITDWGTFLEIWEDLWYPFDWLCVFDETARWTVLFGPGEIVRFAELSIERVVSTVQAD